jgi:protocatechuate 3,4-dioxygenase beta subunit
MRRISIFAVCCTFAILATANPAQQKVDTPPQPTALLEGTVFNAATSEPIRKARVTLTSEQRGRFTYATSTNAAGRFFFKDVSPGRYRLVADRNGFVRGEYGQRRLERGGTPITLDANRKLDGIVIHLTPGAVISGRVYDEDGEPLFGATVQALRQMISRGQPMLVPVQSAQTNDLGEYRIAGLAPGRVYLSVAYPQGMFQAAEGNDPQTQVYVSVYYPGATDFSRAQPLTLVAGQETSRVDLSLIPTPAVSVRGRINFAIDSVRGGGGGVNVTLVPRLGFVRGTAAYRERSAMVQEPQGNFEIRGVPPGSYVLTASAYERDRVYSAREFLDVGRTDVEGLILNPVPGVDAPGHVRIEEEPEFKFSGLNVLFLPKDDPVAGGGSAPVTSDGNFIVRNLPQLTYRVQLTQVPQDCFLKSVKFSSEDALELGINLNRRGTIEIVLSNKGARAEGTVVNNEGEPFAGATVVLIPDASRRHLTHLFKVATTDQAGRFSFRGIAPGNYQVIAWEDIEPGHWQVPEFLGTLERKGESLRADPSSFATLQLKALPAPN